MSRQSDKVAGLYLLFQAGNRPDASTIRSIISGLNCISISHDPEAADGASNTSANWLEIVTGGLTFDITGLAPGEPASNPGFAHSADIQDMSEAAGGDAMLIAPGPHLAGGEYLLPILRGLLSAGSLLGENMPGLLAYGWSPSNSLINKDFFHSNARKWADGGPFPTSVLIRFKKALDGGLHSQGLSVFTGQELRLEPDNAEDMDNAHRLAIRLINQLVLSGKLDAVEDITGPEGNRLRLAPSKNGKYVRVSRR